MSADWKIATAVALLILGLLGARKYLRANVSEDDLARLAQTIADTNTQMIAHGHGRPGTVSVVVEGKEILIAKTGAPDYATRNIITPDTPFTIGPENIEQMLARVCPNIYTALGGTVRIRYVGADGQAVADATINDRLCLGQWLLARDGWSRERPAYVMALALVMTIVLTLIALVLYLGLATAFAKVQALIESRPQ